MNAETVSIEIDRTMAAPLDSIASEEQRDVQSLVTQALEQFVSLEEYHLRCIREGIRQADAGMLTPLEDVLEKMKTWGRNA